MGGYYYTTKTGDMWDYIAWKVYGDERRMEILLRAEENAALIDVYMFSAGEKCGVRSCQTLARREIFRHGG